MSAAKDATLALKHLGYQYVAGPKKMAADLILQPKFSWKGQQDYDAVADAVVKWIKANLVPVCGLEALKLGKATAYTTPNLAKHAGPVLLLVCGAAPGGDCGVWGRALCINDSTLSGSMYETVARAKSRGWAVIVSDPHGCDGAPHKHLLELYKLAGPRPTLIFGHSYGAAMSIGMLKAAEADSGGAEAVRHKVLAVALTDGMVWAPDGAGWRGGGALVHEGLSARADDDDLKQAAKGDAAALTALKARRAELRKWVDEVPRAFDPPSDALRKLLANVGRNWVTSEKPLGTRVAVSGGVMATVSAAVASHPATTFAALDDVFSFLDRAASRRKRSRE